MCESGSRRQEPRSKPLPTCPQLSRCRDLTWLQQELGPQFAAGTILHTGRRQYQLADQIRAIPICTLWT